ncbi:MAG TPA: hypothetical protein VHK90_08600 [Thermoanaerobaculia bacterium]|nr:hypothetical protein [Thermoanaerobaculia bacterium]
MFFLAAATVVALAQGDAHADYCVLVSRDVTTVCADGECWVRTYDTYECYYGGGGGGSTPAGPSGGGTYNPYDTDADGTDR